jgi:probable HAF family extracellular repeat protein
MKLHTQFLAAVALAVVAMTAPPSAQDMPTRHHQYHHYQLIDVGTFGGPQSFLSQTGGQAGILNNRGTLTGAADTLTVDPYCLDNPDCYAAHAYQWQNGVTTDLGVLAGGIGSQINWISARGLMTGISDNGQPDPLSGGTLPQIHGVLWEHGGMTDLGTLPEGGYQSWSNAVNRRGAVVGYAQNTIPDPNSMLTGYGYQSRAFYWKDGVMQDLGTLGTGTDAMAGLINERGQVVGESYLNSIPSAFCSSFTAFTLTTGSFIWDKKNGMQDIGTLGGTCTLANDLNNRGQVVGESSQFGDPTNLAFVWDREAGIEPLPTGANLYGAALAINDAGAISGYGDAPDGQTNAILWQKTGWKWQATYLGNLHSGDCALGVSINASGQVVGVSGPNGCITTHAFLWEDGGPMVDLNTLVPATSGVQLTEAQQINDRGEIAVEGPDANGNNHAVLLIPCDENHPDVEGCDYDTIDAETAAARFSPTPVMQRPATLSSRGRAPGMFNRFRSPGVRLTPLLRTPMPDARQALPDIATDYLQADHGIGTARGRRGYCTANSSGLTGGCVGYSYTNFCSVKRSTACPHGLKAIKPGYYQCALMQKDFVDLGRSCSY